MGEIEEEEVLEEPFAEDEIMNLGPSDIQIEEGMPEDLKAAIRKYNEKHEQLIASYNSMNTNINDNSDSVDEEDIDTDVNSNDIEDNSIDIVEDDSSTEFDNLF